MERQKDEGNPVQYHPHPGQNNKSFTATDYSIAKETSQFYADKRSEGADTGDGVRACRLIRRKSCCEYAAKMEKSVYNRCFQGREAYFD